MDIKKLLSSKKGITLVEMIVGLAIIALVSMALLGLMIPATNFQAQSKLRNRGTYMAAGELEKKIHGSADGNSDLSNSDYIEARQYTLSFTIDGDTYDCEGQLYGSIEPDTGVKLRAFVPDGE
ncbi:MAG: type IV pilus modification PilV family protein [Christensenellales bacterium]